jgi:hypothetical protein
VTPSFLCAFYFIAIQRDIEESAKRFFTNLGYMNYSHKIIQKYRRILIHDSTALTKLSRIERWVYMVKAFNAFHFNYPLQNLTFRKNEKIPQIGINTWK